MLASHAIDVQGRFIGVAVTHALAWRFVAVHPSVEDIDGATFPSPAEARRVAEVVFARNHRLPSAPAFSPPARSAPARSTMEA
jgi:hypothetical protein